MTISSRRESVVHVLLGKLGGVVTSAAVLQARFDRSRFDHEAVVVHHELSRDTRFEAPLPVDREIRFEHSLPLENLYSVIRRFDRSLPGGEGVLVANDWLELATMCRYPTKRLVVQVLHGDSDYYIDLAANHEAMVDVFVACSRRIQEVLSQRIAHRADCIHYVPHGVAIPEATRRPKSGPLRLIYAGRLEQGQKGIFDLPRIDEALSSAGVKVLWTIVGGGPDASKLRNLWKEAPHVRWKGPLDHDKTMETMLEHDVFVLPTRAEGLPVAVLEAMARGLVPVVSNASSGVGELVLPGRTGFRPPVSDIAAFAAAIAELDAQRDTLESLAKGARDLVRREFPLERQVGWYEDVFARWRELRRPKPEGLPLRYGSRLDQPWLPNGIVRLIRAGTRRDLRTAV